MPAILPPLAPANPSGFKLIHADRSLLVVSKPHRLLSVPGRGEDKQDCLIGRVQSEFPDALIVHRLDFDTSGLLVLARGKDMHRRLSILFQERAVDKRYVALVNGRLQPESGEVDLPLIVDWPNRPKQMVDPVNGRPAITDWKVLKIDAGTTRVRLMPQTGRSHQLRVHMLELGHPILGDQIYAEGPARTNYPRMMLHAESLRIRHPELGKTMTFTAPLPF